jgi:Ca-activated chloride channel family protein
VLTFADNARLIVAPTFDRAAVIAGLPGAVRPLAGTRIGDGMNEAISDVIEAVGKGYPGDPQQPGAVVVLSDGAQTAGGVTPEEAANTAYLDGIPIDAVAVGTASGTVSQAVKAAGQTVSTVIHVPVFPESLRAAAQESDGHFLTLNSAAQVTSVAASLGAIFKTLASTTLPGQRERELSTDTAAIALLLVAAGVLLSAFWFGRVA